MNKIQITEKTDRNIKILTWAASSASLLEIATANVSMASSYLFLFGGLGCFLSSASKAHTHNAPSDTCSLNITLYLGKECEVWVCQFLFV